MAKQKQLKNSNGEDITPITSTDSIIVGDGGGSY